MSKIICDVCGTSYPESATQCPICGCARPMNAQTILTNQNDAGAQEEPVAYQYVRGGRFSNSNVRKRNHAAQRRRTSPSAKSQSAARASAERRSAPQKDKSGKGLVITAIVLFLCILAVVAYIVLRFFQPFGDLGIGLFGFGGTNSQEQNAADERPCIGITLQQPVVLFSEPGETCQIEANIMPDDTTDAISYHSSDASVATVNDRGLITAVGKGQAVITVTCGKVSAQCAVNCAFSEEGQPSVDVTDPTEEPTDPVEEFRFNRTKIEFGSEDDSWILYSGNIELSEITWRSDDPSIAKIEDGVVTAVGNGTTMVYGEYNGQTVSCEIICNFNNNQGSSGGVTEDGGDSGSSSGSYQIKSQYGKVWYDEEADVGDVSIKVGESLELSLVDEAGNTVTVSWTVVSGSSCTANGSKITAVASGKTTVSTTYEGKTYTCIVRVSG